ncbi:hypothetical protein COT98_01795 [Candidatus Falkowbacteria bacterium CG10_big_fil_rev_8_21_14_0_10_39_9]|uniref:Uncharacterized protein n=1 Tax=Candidatus Falkowbacteria bacterium CG10_big_fil_rev_8_21_14_0_10_39_9 TaxID=1974566 RepID=A0A2M6WQ43_9BACT|nr:MAG: hypothetical protein COT98_01795 [Candidatus Falkowbacteria bacterium CG10_big_fil_rev_8_21_14_0_10_39_9]
MNGFLQRLEKTLAKINPISCGGFYLMKHMNGARQTIEQIGVLNVSKGVQKDLGRKIKDTLELLMEGALTEKNNKPQNNNSKNGQKVITLYQNKCIVLSGNGRMINEAIAALWLIGREIMIRYNDLTVGFTTSQKFFSEIKIEADVIKKEFFPDNSSLSEIAKLMEDNY